MSFVLSVTNKVTHKVTASLPTEAADRFRKFEFSATFETLPMSEQEGLSLFELTKKSLVSVDFGQQEVKINSPDGTELTHLDIALNNNYLMNALVATYRDKINVANLESKNVNGSRGK